MNQKTKSTLIVLAIAFAAIFTGYIAYQSFVGIPNKKLAQQETERKAKVMEELGKDLDYIKCEATANQSYNDAWESECATRSFPSNCLLPANSANAHEKAKNEALNRCVTLYK